MQLLSHHNDPSALVLSYRDPEHTDEMMDGIYMSARRFGQDMGMEVFVAKEGTFPAMKVQFGGRVFHHPAKRRWNSAVIRHAFSYISRLVGRQSLMLVPALSRHQRLKQTAVPQSVGRAHRLPIFTDHILGFSSFTQSIIPVIRCTCTPPSHRLRGKRSRSFRWDIFAT